MEIKTNYNVYIIQNGQHLAIIDDKRFSRSDFNAHQKETLQTQIQLPIAATEIRDRIAIYVYTD